ncbi:helix-turn-helix domain-containing protein [Microcella frigidaquae]|uniref:Transcriptional regulator with XRE-family HTH domain n=1 Tax=Microcella frigidaquae TaxID=424758 RepID=A0A840X7T0_9MICO|nr:helix-turn-helix transcriptional regulator [Microcella frigidaquae]MBB5618440.1 transcriptional regulator with XRE-family HTH domain [Microcella frigidaquae]NHN44658.1 helix-turn-helix transcriptional regulator [Microcella frigidaquae]
MTSDPTGPAQLSVFAQNVARYRAARGWTQRELAEALSSRGMPVDSTAVSRIENGTRDVRLSEALLIADALSVDLDRLLIGMRSPAQELRHRREVSDDWALQFSEILPNWLHSMRRTSEFLQENPNLVATVFDDRVGRPKSADDYLPWVMRRIRSKNDQFRIARAWQGVVVRTDIEARQLMQVIGAALEGLLTVAEGEDAQARHPHEIVELLENLTFLERSNNGG